MRRRRPAPTARAAAPNSTSILGSGTFVPPVLDPPDDEFPPDELVLPPLDELPPDEDEDEDEDEELLCGQPL